MGSVDDILQPTSMFSQTTSTTRSSFSANLPSTSRSPARAPDRTRPPRRSAAPKFIVKGGKKHHRLDPNVAPYPLNYDSKIVDLDVLDHVFMMQSRKNVTWVDFKDGPPKSSLDLGCGVTWIMDAAKQWPDCHFVGVDLVSIQPSVMLLPPELSERIRWVICNFLNKLPFEDNSFDHVHIYRIAWAVGEMHWDALFEEIARVLRPGGAIEISEEDILFPTLPRSYTLKAKQARPSAPYPRPSLTLSPPPSPTDYASTSIHAHALLESLFFGVFESRMINLRPTSIIPHHLNIHFRHVLSTLKVEFPLPPPPVSRQQLRHMPSDCTERPGLRHSTGSDSSNSSMHSSSSDLLHPQQQTPPATNSSTSSLCHSDPDVEPAIPPSPPSPPLRPPSQSIQTVFGSFGPTTIDVSLLPPVPVNVNDRSLAVHLNAVYQRILGCQEAMWDELCKRIRLRRAGGPDLLHDLGWDDEELEEDAGDSSDSGYGPGQDDRMGWGELRELDRARVRFDELVARYERDMRHRTALSDALEAGLGWAKPAPAPLGKHERAREVELEKAIAAAAKTELEGEEQAQCSRSFKGFIGFKAERRR